MNRRQFAKAITAGVAALGFNPQVFSFHSVRPQVAITIDDFGLDEVSKAEAEARNAKVLSVLHQHKIKAAGFVCGRRVDNENGKMILQAWDAENHLIANHTYSHWYFHRRSVEEFSQDILRCEALIKDYKNFTKRFRFPMLKEGDTVERRDGLRAFLKSQGYQQGYVTIDASDWYVDQRLRERLKQNPQADVIGYKNFYLSHIWDRASFYDQLAKKVLKRQVKHTLLIHHNVLNARFLSEMLAMFKQKGWQLIDAEEAFADPLFAVEPNNLPAGEGIIWALAKATGKFDKLLRYPAEDSEYEKPLMDKLGL
ncbi:MAG: polysaccharide deacetylase family protein [Acidobacteriota bacterium]